MALYKFCSCGLKILMEQGKCPECKAKAEQQRKARLKRYRENREPDKEMQFYNTSQWKKLRDSICNSYLNMSVYSYCNKKKIVPSEVVHHIIEVRDDFDSRLDKYNLIPVTRKEHQIIHSRMDREGKETVRLELEEMLENFRKEFDIKL